MHGLVFGSYWPYKHRDAILYCDNLLFLYRIGANSKPAHAFREEQKDTSESVGGIMKSNNENLNKVNKNNGKENTA